MQNCLSALAEIRRGLTVQSPPFSIDKVWPLTVRFRSELDRLSSLRNGGNDESSVDVDVVRWERCHARLILFFFGNQRVIGKGMK